MSDQPSTRPLEQIASEWLAAERQLTENPSITGEAIARELAAEYELGVRAATQEELRLVWEAARAAQARCEMGSAEWAEARRVSELLRTEYGAVQGAADPAT
jgi:hypothetical protein